MVDFVFSGPTQTGSTGDTITGTLTDNGPATDVSFTLSIVAGNAEFALANATFGNPTPTTVTLSLRGSMLITPTSTTYSGITTARFVFALTGGRYFEDVSLSGFGGGFQVTYKTTKGSTFTRPFSSPDFVGNVVSFTVSVTTPRGFAGLQGIQTRGIQCFCAGTGIATPDGTVPVERLQPGDRLLTADGGETRVKWLGVQPVDVRLSHPARVNPIRITAGALGNGLPERDLHLSADHAIAIDGLLINAGALVNGETITRVRDMPLDGFTYYHVETEAHELILAEGCPAESFIDYADTGSFVNGDERDGAAPIPEVDLPRISAARLVPQALRTRLTHVGAQAAAA